MTNDFTSPPEAAPTLRILTRVADAPKEAWDALVPPEGRPFLAWDFLDVLERSGSAVPSRGWTPAHITLWEEETLVAFSPAYVKTHSMGEFFYNDFEWARALGSVGVRYYPKLVVGIPFSPATGPRLLGRTDTHRRVLAQALAKVAKTLGCSSANVLFPLPDDLALLEEAGFHAGAGVQFQWTNQGYGNFDDFLGRFNAKRRRMLKDERKQLAKDGTTIEVVRGDDLTAQLMAFASRCYETTVESHHYGQTHLTPAFFDAVRVRLPEHVELVIAREGGAPIACAFNLRSSARLYGRTWGAVEERKFLHFNVCYYASIERAIEAGLQAFEPGAGGNHKLARGMEPTLVQSAHIFTNTAVDRMMGEYLAQASAAYAQDIARARDDGLAFRAGSGSRGR